MESGVRNHHNQLTLGSIVALSAPEAAPLLLGVIVVSNHQGKTVEAVITEVEAYTQDDPASHTFSGPTERNSAMYGEPGKMYVYFSYGMHFCMNVVCGPKGRGEGVLIRAVRIINGLEIALMRRYGESIYTPYQLKNVSNGPGKVTQALGVTRADYGKDLLDETSMVYLRLPEPGDPLLINQTPRIGISKAQDVLWRWHL